MGEVLPFRNEMARRRESADPARMIGLAYQMAAQRLALYSWAIPRERACSVLLHRIIESAGRGMRSVNELSEDALAHLRLIEREGPR
jgi:hypothetical protein